MYAGKFEYFTLRYWSYKPISRAGEFFNTASLQNAIELDRYWTTPTLQPLLLCITFDERSNCIDNSRSQYSRALSHLIKLIKFELVTWAKVTFLRSFDSVTQLSLSHHTSKLILWIFETMNRSVGLYFSVSCWNCYGRRIFFISSYETSNIQLFPNKNAYYEFLSIFPVKNWQEVPGYAVFPSQRSLSGSIHIR